MTTPPNQPDRGAKANHAAEPKLAAAEARPDSATQTNSAAQPDSNSTVGTDSTGKPPRPREGRAPAPAKSPLIIVLLVLLGLLLVALGFMMGRWVASPTQTDASPAADRPAASSDTKGNSTAAPTQAPTVSQEILDLLRAQPKREANDPFAKGKVDAPVVMVEYSDFSCPFCANFANTTEKQLQQLIDDGTLRVEWRDLALFPEGQTTAAAAHAAAAQGKFWEFHDAVFADHSGNGHPSYTEDQYVEFAKTAGVPDLDAFRAALQDDTNLQTVKDNTDTVIRTLGLTGTPAFIINDAVISGAQPADVFLQTIKDQRELVGK